MGKKLKGLQVIVMTMAMVFFMAVGVEKEVEAAFAEVDNLVQTGATSNSITLSWTGENAALYNVYTKDEQYNDVLIGQTAEMAYTITGLESATKYSFKVKAVAATPGDYEFSDSIYDAVTLPDEMKNVHQTRWWRFAKSCDIAWDRMSAMEGYEYQFKNASGKTVKKGSLDGYASSVSFAIQNNQIYTFKIRGYMNFGGQTYYTPWKQINCFEQAWVKSISQKKGALTIKWTKVKGATGYDIYVSTKQKSGYKKVKSVGKNTTSFTVKKFNKKKISNKKTYYVYVATRKKKDTSGANYVWNSKLKGKSFDYIN